MGSTLRTPIICHAAVVGAAKKDQRQREGGQKCFSLLRRVAKVLLALHHDKGSQYMVSTTPITPRGAWATAVGDTAAANQDNQLPGQLTLLLGQGWQVRPFHSWLHTQHASNAHVRSPMQLCVVFKTRCKMSVLPFREAHACCVPYSRYTPWQLLNQ